MVLYFSHWKGCSLSSINIEFRISQLSFEISTSFHNVNILHTTLILWQKKLHRNPYWSSRTPICTYTASFGVKLVSEWELLKLLNRTFGPRFAIVSNFVLIEKHSNLDSCNMQIALSENWWHPALRNQKSQESFDWFYYQTFNPETQRSNFHRTKYHAVSTKPRITRTVIITRYQFSWSSSPILTASQTTGCETKYTEQSVKRTPIISSRVSTSHRKYNTCILGQWKEANKPGKVTSRQWACSVVSWQKAVPELEHQGNLPQRRGIGYIMHVANEHDRIGNKRAGWELGGVGWGCARERRQVY